MIKYIVKVYWHGKLTTINRTFTTREHAKAFMAWLNIPETNYVIMTKI